MKKIFIIGAIIIIVLALVLSYYFLFIKRQIVPLMIDAVPTFSPGVGEGIDIYSKPVRISQKEIEKLVEYLPYEEEFTSSLGVPVTIVIPSSDLGPPYILTVQIFGIDYGVVPSDPEYEEMRKSFKEGAERAFIWIKEKGASPSKIIMNWGHKAFVQQTAEQWLRGK
ncbi:MAG TPA: hypothetical protein VJH96_02730 [Patescibacteria group bacterium]|nr:hypothetical protein [Patescibacteria group bacterium]